MPDLCPMCGVDVDASIDPVRVIDGTVVAVCRPCSKVTYERAESAEIAAGLERVFECGCGETVALWRAVTVVTAGGVGMMCPTCVARAETEPLEQPPSIAPPPSTEREQPEPEPEPKPLPGLAPTAAITRTPSRRSFKAMGAVVAMAAVAALGFTTDGFGMAASANDAEIALAETLPEPQPEPEPEPEPKPEPKPEPEPEPTPRSDWIYPLAGVDKYEPSKPGSFGSHRDGRRPKECRRGHCGVDLHGPRGLPIVAVKDAVIDFIGKRRWRKSGLYVKLRHADGSMTYYMHLDEIRRGLRVGQAVRAGEMVGTLGRTGIRKSPAHLHFAWQLPISDRGWYADPKPLLDGSKTLDTEEVINLDKAAVKRGQERHKKRIEYILKRRRRARRS